MAALAAAAVAVVGVRPAIAAPPAEIPLLQINAGRITARVSPMLYGLMTEEINYSYEGGLYGELIRNRTFKAGADQPVDWRAVGGATLALDKAEPLNSALDVSLRVDTGKATATSPAGIANGGYWGIPVRADTTYHASFYARGRNFAGPLTVSLVSVKDGTVFARGQVGRISPAWAKYELTLKTGDVAPSKDNELTVTTTNPGTGPGGGGTVWFQQVSLFPPTYHDRSNGNRPDLMRLLAALEPKFLRFPGGNYLEGRTIAQRFDWEKTIGDPAQRPGHESPWGYWSTDGMGLLEFLEWCEDLHMQPVLAVYAGYSLDHEHVTPGPDLAPYVQDALDEIEYVTGGPDTRWGAQRAKDGHPAAFPLRYVEIGNEDWFDRSGSYDERFAQFYDAIKARYPDLQIIATTRVTIRRPDVIDEHYYRSEEAMEAQAHLYDDRPRTGPKVFVGEWATRVGSPTPNMAGALGDAAWMCDLERNSDLVVMASYAPLFVNVSDLARGGSMQWRSDLIGYDALTCYGSPSYYAQVMFSTHHGDEVLATAAQGIPTHRWQPPARTRRGVPEGPVPAPREVPSLFYNATRDSRSGTIFLKVVNPQGTAQAVRTQISGVPAVEPQGRAVVLRAANPDDTNSISQPDHIVPVTATVGGLGTDFTREYPPYSITILELKSR